MSDTAAGPEPVGASGPTGPTGACCSGPTGSAPVDNVTKTSDEIAGMYNVVDWKKPVPTALAIFAHVSTMTALTGDERTKVVQQVLVNLANKAPVAETEKQTAMFFANEILPHVLHALEVVTAGKAPVVDAIKDFAQKEMKGVAPLVLPEIQKVSGWCCK